jgi:hypothetical protein
MWGGAPECASTSLTGLDANPHCPKNPAIPYALRTLERNFCAPVPVGPASGTRKVEEEREIRSGPPRPDYGCEKENKWQRVL